MRIKILTFSVLLWHTILLLQPLQGLAQNLIVNGSFETGNATGWTTSGTFVFENSLGSASDGVWVVAFGGSSANTDGVFQQTFSTLRGQSYSLALDFGKNGNEGPARLLVEVIGASSLLSQTLSDNTFSPTPDGTVSETLDHYSFTFVADSGAATLRLSDRSTGNTPSMDAQVDNVSVTPMRSLDARRAKATGVLVNGFLVEVKVTDGGAGYTNAPGVTVTGGGGSGATAFSTISNGSVDRVFILNSGSGFTALPTITIDPPFSQPSLTVAVATVAVKMNVIEGRKYQLESSRDFQTWQSAGIAFVAETSEVTRFFDVLETGQFFRLSPDPRLIS